MSHSWSSVSIAVLRWIRADQPASDQQAAGSPADTPAPTPTPESSDSDSPADDTTS